MRVAVAIRNDSARKRLVRRDRLERLALRVCGGETLHGDIEISVLLCDDPAIAELNRRYSDQTGATDVLSFEQSDVPAKGSRPLGDIVISLETAERNCGGERALLRAEVEMLFCHGLLHLLGYDHATERGRSRMQRKQAEYLGRPDPDAWNFGPKVNRRSGTGGARSEGGLRRIGR